MRRTGGPLKRHIVEKINTRKMVYTPALKARGRFFGFFFSYMCGRVKGAAAPPMQADTCHVICLTSVCICLHVHQPDGVWSLSTLFTTQDVLKIYLAGRASQSCLARRRCSINRFRMFRMCFSGVVTVTKSGIKARQPRPRQLWTELRTFHPHPDIRFGWCGRLFIHIR